MSGAARRGLRTGAAAPQIEVENEVEVEDGRRCASRDEVEDEKVVVARWCDQTENSN